MRIPCFSYLKATTISAVSGLYYVDDIFEGPFFYFLFLVTHIVGFGWIDCVSSGCWGRPKAGCINGRLSSLYISHAARLPREAHRFIWKLVNGHRSYMDWNWFAVTYSHICCCGSDCWPCLHYIPRYSNIVNEKTGNMTTYCKVMCTNGDWQRIHGWKWKSSSPEILHLAPTATGSA